MTPLDKAELTIRYSRPAPRYTSYPSAARFEPISVETEERLLAGSNRNLPVSLYFHIPFCRNVCFFCGCSVVYTKNQARSEPYLEHLSKEVHLVADRLGERRQSDQIHFGGGTPNFLRAEQFDKFYDVITSRFDILPDAEKSVELDPRTLEDSHFEVLSRRGFNRVSVGIQDLDPVVQRAVNRIQPMEMIDSVYKKLRALKIHVNFDLIYGLPNQTHDSFARTMEGVIQWRPDRIALFHFAYIPELKKHQRRIDPNALPDPDAKLELFDLATKMLTKAGYESIGLDHFALPDDSLYQAMAAGTLRRNFQGYTTTKGDLIGFGATSISEFEGGYSQNAKDLAVYGRAIEAGTLPTERGLLLNDDDRLRKSIIMQLMTYMRLSPRDVESRWKINFASYFAPELREMAELERDGLVVMRGNDIFIRETARPFIRNVAMVFDAHSRAGTTIMSKAV